MLLIFVSTCEVTARETFRSDLPEQYLSKHPTDDLNETELLQDE